MLKMEKPNMAITMGNLLPFSSDRGAQRVGPNAKPRTYRETPSKPTSEETPYWAPTTRVAAEKILEPNADTMVVYPKMAAV